MSGDRNNHQSDHENGLPGQPVAVARKALRQSLADLILMPDNRVTGTCTMGGVSSVGSSHGIGTGIGLEGLGHRELSAHEKDQVVIERSLALSSQQENNHDRIHGDDSSSSSSSSSGIGSGAAEEYNSANPPPSVPQRPKAVDQSSSSDDDATISCFTNTTTTLSSAPLVLSDSLLSLTSLPPVRDRDDQSTITASPPEVLPSRRNHLSQTSYSHSNNSSIHNNNNHCYQSPQEQHHQHYHESQQQQYQQLQYSNKHNASDMQTTSSEATDNATTSERAIKSPNLNYDDLLIDLDLEEEEEGEVTNTEAWPKFESGDKTGVARSELLLPPPSLSSFSSSSSSSSTLSKTPLAGADNVVHVGIPANKNDNDDISSAIDLDYSSNSDEDNDDNNDAGVDDDDTSTFNSDFYDNYNENYQELNSNQSLAKTIISTHSQELSAKQLLVFNPTTTTAAGHQILPNDTNPSDKTQTIIEKINDLSMNTDNFNKSVSDDSNSISRKTIFDEKNVYLSVLYCDKASASSVATGIVESMDEYRPNKNSTEKSVRNPPQPLPSDRSRFVNTYANNNSNANDIKSHSSYLVDRGQVDPRLQSLINNGVVVIAGNRIAENGNFSSSLGSPADKRSASASSSSSTTVIVDDIDLGDDVEDDKDDAEVDRYNNNNKNDNDNNDINDITKQLQKPLKNPVLDSHIHSHSQELGSGSDKILLSDFLKANSAYNFQRNSSHSSNSHQPEKSYIEWVSDQLNHQQHHHQQQEVNSTPSVYSSRYSADSHDRMHASEISSVAAQGGVKNTKIKSNYSNDSNTYKNNNKNNNNSNNKNNNNSSSSRGSGSRGSFGSPVPNSTIPTGTGTGTEDTLHSLISSFPTHPLTSTPFVANSYSSSSSSSSSSIPLDVHNMVPDSRLIGGGSGLHHSSRGLATNHPIIAAGSFSRGIHHQQSRLSPKYVSNVVGATAPGSPLSSRNSAVSYSQPIRRETLVDSFKSVRRKQPSDLTDGKMSISQLKKVGYSASELIGAAQTQTQGQGQGQTQFSPKQLKKCGYSAGELKDAGVSLVMLSALSYTGKELRAAGFPAQEMLGLGYSISSLQRFGYTALECANAMSSASTTTAISATSTTSTTASMNVNDDNNGEKPRSNSRQKMRTTTAASTSTHLLCSGFSPVEAVSAVHRSPDKYIVSELRKTGLVSAEDLKDVGYGDFSLYKAGFNVDEIESINYDKYE